MDEREDDPAEEKVVGDDLVAGGDEDIDGEEFWEVLWQSQNQDRKVSLFGIFWARISCKKSQRLVCSRFSIEHS